ncbi:MAG: outer membrane lipoprotein carrier protein LolA [Candidatus Electryoneaceae bacterium]|nr:outer membrane lipoprotein carrier protein LolA [Candidatus Electryoneaceae bacterium]
MKPHLLIGLTVLLLTFVIGRQVEAMSPKSAMKQISRHYKRVETLQADFREVFEWGLTRETIERDGTLAVASDNRFRIDTPEQLLVSDGECVYRFDRTNARVIIEPVGSGGSSLLPQRLLLEFGDDFRAVSLTETMVAGRDGIRLELVPRDPDTALIEKVILWVTTPDDSGNDDWIIHRLKMADMSGNHTTYFLSNIRLDQPIDPDATSFIPPEGVELFDLR